jgi:hypothetical protein
MPALYTHPTRADGTTLTASIYNADHQNHIDNGVPSQLDDYSSNVSQMQTSTNPGGVGTESLASSLAGELERLRYIVKLIGGGAQWYAPVFKAAENVALPNDITPTTITADQNDYNPPNLATAAVLRLASDASRSITGLQGGSDGRLLLLTNIGSNPIVLKHANSLSLAANRFNLTSGEDITLSAFASQLIHYDGTSQRWRAMQSAISFGVVSGTGILRNMITGLIATNNGTDPDNDIDVSVGAAMHSTNTEVMELTSVITKRLDATWVVGTNQGGLDTGSKAADTWYFVWLIKRPDTDVVDVLFSTSSSTPTMPTDYTMKRLIGAFKTDGSSNILAFEPDETAGGGLQFLWSDPPLDVNVTEDTVANTRTLGGIMPGVVVDAILNVYVENTSNVEAFAYISSPFVSNEIASTSAAPLASVGVSTSSVGDVVAAMVRVRTNSSGQVRTIASQASTTIRIATLGFDWSRR